VSDIYQFLSLIISVVFDGELLLECLCYSKQKAVDFHFNIIMAHLFVFIVITKIMC